MLDIVMQHHNLPGNQGCLLFVINAGVCDITIINVLLTMRQMPQPVMHVKIKQTLSPKMKQMILPLLQILHSRWIILKESLGHGNVYLLIYELTGVY